MPKHHPTPKPTEGTSSLTLRSQVVEEMGIAVGVAVSLDLTDQPAEQPAEQ